MRRAIICILTLAMMISYSALAEFNVQDMTDEELISLRNTVSDEIESRGLVPQDFFDSEDRYDAFSSAMKAFDFSTLSNMIDSYITDYRPGADDSAYILRETLDNLSAYLENTYTVTDDFDGTVFLHFNGCSEINEEINVVPYIEYDIPYVKFGFVKKGWLFFDGIAISADGNVIMDNSAYKSYDPDEEILDAGFISEIATDQLVEDDSFFDAIHGAEKVVVRFSSYGKDDKYDHEMTEIERESVYAAHMIVAYMNSMYHTRNERYSAFK